MSNERFNPGDWVTIKYGEYAGQYGKVCMLERSGSYLVIPYNKKDEPCEMKSFLNDAIEPLPPYVLDAKEFRDLLKGKIFYSELSDKVFPPFNIKAEKKYKLTAKDIRMALKNINKTETMLSTFKEWFWLIINVFYEDLKIEERYDEMGLTESPETDDELFSDVFGLTEKLYWRLEERFSKKEDNEKYNVNYKDAPQWNKNALNDDELEKAAYLTVCNDIISRVSIYEKNKKDPDGKKEYSISQKKIFIGEIDEKVLARLAPEELKKYRHFVLQLAAENDAQAMHILAWSYYDGTAAFRQNWAKAEEWLLKIFDVYGDPFAANALGYIYYYGRTNNGKPMYEEAFKYFSFGALAGIDESIYKAGDMLIHGQGTTKSIDMGIQMIVDGYRASLDEFCMGAIEGKFADYALRMGNICKEKLLYGMGMRDAYKFYLEALYAIRERRAIADFYGDAAVEKKILKEVEQIQKDLELDLTKTELKADFPIYINQLFEDPFPLKVTIKQDENGEIKLKVARFRLDEDLTKDLPLPDKLKAVPQILASYPELSYVELTPEMNFTLENGVIMKMPERGDYFLSDGFRKNEMTGAIEFFSNGQLVAAVEAEWYVINVERS